MPTESDELALLLQQLDGEPWTRRVRRSDPRHGNLVRQLSATATSLAAAIEELRRLPADAPARGHHAETLRTAMGLAASAPETTVEDDLERILDRAGLSSRQRTVVARRLGWDGNGGMTLEAAANGELSRERVRQLEEKVKSASATTQWLPAVESALDLLTERAPLARDEAAELLAVEGLARRPFDPVGLLNAVRLAGIESRLTVTAGCLYARDQRERAVRVGEAARKLVSRNGAANIGAISYSLDDSVDRDDVRRVLALDPETRWLDRECEWLFLPTGRNRAATHLRKMLAVAPSLSVGDVREGFRRYRDREVILPRRVVRELCACFDWVRVDGDRIAAAVSLDYRAVLENTEETLVDIFREDGPVLDRATAVDLGERRGLDRTTTGLYLGWSPIIERIATNRYALRGADVPAGTLEAMQGSSPRRRVQRGYGWTSGGRLWVCYTLSQAVIDSKVVGVPSALKGELRRGGEVARYELAAPNDDLGELATDGTNIWGLSRLLRRYAAEAGDALVVEFDLVARSAQAFVGGEELLDPDSLPAEVLEDPAPATAADSRPHHAGGVTGADASVDRAAADEPGSTLGELVPTLPALFDSQLDLAATDVHPAEDARAGAEPRVAEATLLEALAPGRRSIAETNEEPIERGVESAGGSRGDERSKAAADERPTLPVPEAPGGSDLPDTAEKVVQRCAVPGCKSRGKHRLGVRCRVWDEPSPIAGKSKTSALWAPDSDAYLCDQHALGGAQITLIFEPNDSRETAVKVIAAPYANERRTPIRHEPREGAL